MTLEEMTTTLQRMVEIYKRTHPDRVGELRQDEHAMEMMRSWIVLRKQIAPQLDALLKLMADARLLHIHVPINGLPEDLDEDAKWLHCMVVDAHPDLKLECGPVTGHGCESI
jgi:hypothetical protein